MRKSYSKRTLSEDSIFADPIQQFAVWMNDAIYSKIIEPNAMILATANLSGVPSLRTVLLKDFNNNGFVFFTNYKSAKAKDLYKNPNASLLFFWDILERQVRITGKVKKVTVEESADYFKSRPRENQLGAWASQQSSFVANRQVFENKYKELAEKYKGKQIPLPPFWGGYRVIPKKFEFWQGRENRLHDRICYFLIKGKWQIKRLSP